MDPIFYLFLPVAISAAGCSVLYVRQVRMRRSRSTEGDIEVFQQTLRAMTSGTVRGPWGSSAAKS